MALFFKMLTTIVVFKHIMDMKTKDILPGFGIDFNMKEYMSVEIKRF